MSRLAKKTLALALLVTLTLASSEALAYEVIPFAEVPKLAGQKVWIGVPCRARPEKGGEVHLFVGQEVTIKGRGKNIDAWAEVEVDGKVLNLMVENLSKSKPRYSQLATGTLEELLPKVFAEAFDIPLALADLWKSHDYSLDKDDAARNARNAYEHALEAHKALLYKLVHGRESKATVLREESKAWLAKADPSVLDAYCEGMTYLAQWKKSEFLKKAEAMERALSQASSVAEAASGIMMQKGELARKPWLQGLRKDVSKEQRDALDKEECAKREKKIAQLEERMTKNREAALAAKEKLGL